MNDSNLRDIPEEAGYSLPLFLSIGVHVLLAGFLWAGATMPRGPSMEDVPLGTHPLPAQHTGASSPHRAPDSLRANASSAPIRTSTTRESQATPVKAENGKRSAHPLAMRRASPVAADAPRKANQQSSAGSGKPSKAKQKSVELAAAKKIEKQSSKNTGIAQKQRKTGDVSPRRIAKADSNRNTKKDPGKRVADSRDATEIKKLEAMREAELRRISKSVS